MLKSAGGVILLNVSRLTTFDMKLQKIAIVLSLVHLAGPLSIPALAQSAARYEPLDDVSSSRSKLADVDIVTDSPTLGTAPQQQQGAVSSFAVQSVPVTSGVTQSNYCASPQTGQQVGQPVAASQQPIQIDSQTVGRVVGVAGTALLLGAFLKNGGVGGMMNSLGLDNRFHGRGPSPAAY